MMARCTVASFLLACLIAPSLQSPYVTVPYLGVDELPLRVGGSRPFDYDFSIQKTWIRAKPEASRGFNDYVALMNRVDASAAWGCRVRLSGWLETKGVVGSAWGGLFVRVDAADGTVLAFDNMRHRPIRSALAKEDFYDVVLDVPGKPPADGTECANPSKLPVDIWVGVFLCGGLGWLWVDSLHFDVVGPEVRVTNSPPPWTGPGDPY